MDDKNAKKGWIRYRHRVASGAARAVLAPYSAVRYGVRAERFDAQGNRAYLILLNHQTPFDQFFVGTSFRGPVYYLATEDIFSLGIVSSLLRWLIAPIPIKKQTSDIKAVRDCIRVAREGGTIAIAPEGNRTYSGRTEYMRPSIAALAKKLGLPIALYRIEGGYGVQPRWSDAVRRGRMRAYVSRVIEPEEYKSWTKDELFKVISDGLFVDEASDSGLFLSDKRAEYLERAIYVCPYCGLSEFESSGNIIECKKCHRKVVYGEDKRLRGLGFSFPFDFVAQWYDYQKDFVNALEPEDFTLSPLYRDTASLYEVILNERKLLLRKSAVFKLYGDRITVDEDKPYRLILPFSEISAIAVLGRNKLNIYHGDRVYQLKGSKRFNALKYVNIYFRHKNISEGNKDGKFLGL